MLSCRPVTKDDSGKQIEIGCQTVLVNQCQYVMYVRHSGNAGASLTHAGNCNNPQHQFGDLWDATKYHFDSTRYRH